MATAGHCRSLELLIKPGVDTYRARPVDRHPFMLGKINVVPIIDDLILGCRFRSGPLEVAHRLVSCIRYEGKSSQ